MSIRPVFAIVKCCVAAIAVLLSATTIPSAAVAADGELPDVACWVVDPLLHVLDDVLPDSAASRAVVIHAARGEFENGQIGLRANKLVKNLKISLPALRGPNGARLPRVSVHPIARLRMDANTAATPLDDLVAKAPFNLPDVLTDIEEFDLHPGYTQAVWVKVWVPREAAPGTYEGQLEIRSASGVRNVPVQVHVHDVTIPRTCHLDVVHWMDLAWMPTEVRKDRDALKAYWRRMFADMVEHRQNVFVAPGFTAYAHSINYPGDAIKIIEEPGGALRLDYTEFDEVVQMAFDAGFEKVIPGHIGYRGGGWNGAHVLNYAINLYNAEGKRTGQIPQYESYDPGFRRTMNAMLPKFYKHLEEKGWRDRVLFHHLADEPLPNCAPAYNYAADIVRQAVPGLRVVDALLAEGIASGGAIVPMNLWWCNREYWKQREAQGDLVWQYTCRWPRGRYPNFFPDYPLVRARMVAWFNWRYAIPGYLNWNYNEAQPTKFPAALHEPGSMAHYADAYDFCSYVVGAPRGPHPSVRWEALRDGREDFELLRIVALQSPKVSRELVLEAMPNPIAYIRDPSKFRALHRRLLEAAERAAREVNRATIESSKTAWIDVPDRPAFPAACAERADSWRPAANLDLTGKTLPDTWQVVAGQWEVKDGWLVATGPVDAKTGKPLRSSRILLCRGQFDGDMRLEYEFQTEADPPGAAVACLYCGEPLEATGYRFEFGTDENAFCKIVAEHSELDIRESIRIRPKIVHRIVAQREGDALALFVDGQLAAGALDIARLQGKGHGQFGVLLSCDGKIRNVSLFTRTRR